MPKKKKKQSPRDRLWAQLTRAIQRYADAQEQDSWKGVGDPESIPAIEAHLRLTRAKLNAIIAVLRREYED